MHRLELDGRDLAYATWGSGPAEIVMLHDGLGSVRQWRGVPEALHEATGRTVLAYERAGHGSSLPAPEGAWPADWLHREAELLAALLEQVADPDVGAHGWFLGVTRRTTGDRVTDQLSYEAHRPMRRAASAPPSSPRDVMLYWSSRTASPCSTRPSARKKACRCG